MKKKNILTLLPILAPGVLEPPPEIPSRNIHAYGGRSALGGTPEFHPRRKKFKGWQRENRRYNSKLYR